MDAGTGFAWWLKDTFGTIPQDMLGIAGGDWLHHQRRRNLLAIEAKTEAIRQRIAAGPAHEPSVSVVLPLLQAAADEARPELQELWAALLVSAMQPDGGSRVRRAFFETLRQMEPPDAVMFRALIVAHQATTAQAEQAAAIATRIGLYGSVAEIAWEALDTLRLVHRYPGGGVQATAYGLEFWRACNP